MYHKKATLHFPFTLCSADVKLPLRGHQRKLMVDVVSCVSRQVITGIGWVLRNLGRLTTSPT